MDLPTAVQKLRKLLPRIVFNKISKKTLKPNIYLYIYIYLCILKKSINKMHMT